MRNEKKKIYVYADWVGLDVPTLMGVLSVDFLRGKEIVVNELAKKTGINTAESFIKKHNNKHHTYLTKRFDRTDGKQIHFSSAMTLLGYTDGFGAEEGVSYLELVAFIIQNGANVKEDLAELFRRIVFFIAVSNTDDHLTQLAVFFPKKASKIPKLGTDKNVYN